MSTIRYPEYKRAGVAWLGEVPSHWSLEKVKQFAQFSGGGTPSRENAAYWNGEIPWIFSKDMKFETIRGAEESITPEGLANSSSNVVPVGSLLMVVRSGILKHTIPVGITDTPVAVNQDLKVFSTADELQAALDRLSDRLSAADLPHGELDVFRRALETALEVGATKFASWMKAAMIESWMADIDTEIRESDVLEGMYREEQLSAARSAVRGFVEETFTEYGLELTPAELGELVDQADIDGALELNWGVMMRENEDMSDASQSASQGDDGRAAIDDLFERDR